MRLFEPFSVTGVANQVTYDGGLKSTEAQKKKLVSVLIQVSGYQGNEVQGYYEREKVFGIPDYLIDTVESTGGTNTQRSYERLLEIEVGLTIPPGDAFKAAIQCGAATNDIRGAYCYEIAE